MSSAGSDASSITKAAVIGGGQMGAGIAEVLTRAGVDTVVVEVTSAAAIAAETRIFDSLQRAERRGKISVGELRSAISRLTVTTNLDSVVGRNLVIEAAREDENVKLQLFSDLGQLVRVEDAILASNTSSIPIAKLAAASGRAEQVLGVHFFNPAPIMRLVELIPSLATSSETLQRMRDFATKTLGKEAIEATDRAGFVVNSLLVPYLLSAIRMYEAGHASAVDIDQGMKLGCGHPMGPLALADLIGLDTVRAIGTSLYQEFKEPLYAPPPLLDRMVEAGLLGHKTQQGFHSYRS